MIRVKNLKKYFGNLKAVDDISFEIKAGETLGLVGESGCGKSTLGKTLLGLEKTTSGEIFFEGKGLSQITSSIEQKKLRREMQIIFQDPYASLNPRMTAGDIIAEPLDIHKLFSSKKEREEKILRLLSLVGLPAYMRSRFPHEFSGGQRQRIGIARALAPEPKFIICDEPISALDVSVQAQIVNLLKKLQQEMGLTYLFIAHDLAMVKYLSTKVAVMYLGHIVELASSEELYNSPRHPYTQALLSAIPIPDPVIEKTRTRIILKGEIPSPINPPKGCIFSGRCPLAKKECYESRPQWKELSSGHFAACHLYSASN